MARSLPTRPVNANLSEAINHRLNLYSLAVAGASVSMLALSQPAEATVVITNKNIPIPNCSEFFPCSVSVDLNGDGINDVKFSLVSFYSYSGNSQHLNVTALNGGGVVGSAGHAHGPYASPLLRGAKIGASDHFSGGKHAIEISSRQYNRSSGRLSKLELYGKWGGNHPNRFLGVKFRINGKTHFGWLRITVSTPSPSCVPDCSSFLSGTITEYGYETVANKSLDAGLAGAASADSQAHQTVGRQSYPSLGMLALGADGLSLWRREEELVH